MDTQKHFFFFTYFCQSYGEQQICHKMKEQIRTNKCQYNETGCGSSVKNKSNLIQINTKLKSGASEESNRSQILTVGFREKKIISRIELNKCFGCSLHAGH